MTEVRYNKDNRTLKFGIKLIVVVCLIQIVVIVLLDIYISGNITKGLVHGSLQIQQQNLLMRRNALAY